MSYYGNFRPGQTVRIRFNTINPATGVPASLTGATVTVTKDSAAVTPSGGVTLTTDLNSVVGLNHVLIDTSVDTTTFTAGSEYAARLTAGTVGGASVVGIVLGEWSILNRAENIDSNGRVLLQPTQTGVTIPTVTALTNAVVLPANPPAGFLVAGSIAANALAGKGDWNTIAPDNATIAAIAGYVDTEVASVKLITDKLATMLQGSGPYAYTSAALANAPTGGGGGGTGLTAQQTRDAMTLNTLVGSPAAGSIDAVLATIAGYIDTEIASIKAVTDKLNSMLAFVSGSTYQYTTGALANAPAGGGGSGNPDVYTGVQLTEAMKVVLAVLAGKSVGAGTNQLKFYDVHDPSILRVTLNVNTASNERNTTVADFDS